MDPARVARHRQMGNLVADLDTCCHCGRRGDDRAISGVLVVDVSHLEAVTRTYHPDHAKEWLK
jgi:hypothetical protein